MKWQDVMDEREMPPSERNPVYVAEARALALRLRELVDAGEIRRSETVVLLRAFTHVDAYEEALSRAGLDPYVVGGRGYWSQQQVEDLIRVLAVVANPLDDEMLFGALAVPAIARQPGRALAAAPRRRRRPRMSGRSSSGRSVEATASQARRRPAGSSRSIRTTAAGWRASAPRLPSFVPRRPSSRSTS